MARRANPPVEELLQARVPPFHLLQLLVTLLRGSDENENASPETRNPKDQPLDCQLYTLNPQTQTLKRQAIMSCSCSLLSCFGAPCSGDEPLNSKPIL